MNSKTLPLQSIYSYMSKRASVSASDTFVPESRGMPVIKSQKASITIEAAMAVPIFFLAVVCLLYLMEIMAIRTSVRCGLQYAGKMAAEEACAMNVIMPSKIENDVVHAIGAERLERSIVLGGCRGIRCDESRISLRTGIRI